VDINVCRFISNELNSIHFMVGRDLKLIHIILYMMLSMLVRLLKILNNVVPYTPLDAQTLNPGLEMNLFQMK
jgi:hypothetical protein